MTTELLIDQTITAPAIPAPPTEYTFEMWYPRVEEAINALCATTKITPEVFASLLKSAYLVGKMDGLLECQR